MLFITIDYSQHIVIGQWNLYIVHVFPDRLLASDVSLAQSTRDERAPDSHPYSKRIFLD